MNPLSISDLAGLSRIAIVGAADLTFSAFAVGHICYLYSAFHNFKVGDHDTCTKSNGRHPMNPHSMLRLRSFPTCRSKVSSA